MPQTRRKAPDRAAVTDAVLQALGDEGALAWARESIEDALRLQLSEDMSAAGLHNSRDLNRGLGSPYKGDNGHAPYYRFVMANRNSRAAAEWPSDPIQLVRDVAEVTGKPAVQIWRDAADRWLTRVLQRAGERIGDRATS